MKKPCLLLFLFLLGQFSAYGQTRGITATAKSPYVKLKSVNIDQVRWTRGFWADRFALARNAVIPHVWSVMQLPGNAAYYGNLRSAAGLEKGEFRGAKWSDADVYKWLEAVAHVYSLTHDKKLDQWMDEVIEVIGKAQAPDGYISTHIQLRDNVRWGQKGFGELHNMGHLMTTACIHYRATGKTNLLRIATSLADHLYTVFKPRRPEFANLGAAPSNIMAAVELYRTTGDARYLELASIFLDIHGSVPGGTDNVQTGTPFRQEQEAVGHAVSAMFLYNGAADVYAETGDKTIWETLDRLWRNVTTRRMAVTGAVGPLHHGSSHRPPNSSQTDLVQEAFGLIYQLPSRTAHNETCGVILNGMWNWRMLTLTGDAKYADLMEIAFYSMLAGVGIEGKSFFYTNPLARYSDDLPLLWLDTAKRWPSTVERGTPRSFCCPASIVRALPSIHEYAYSVSEQSVWVNLYGSNSLDTTLFDGERLRLMQESDYPWDGAVKITFDAAPAREHSLMLRIPAWGTGSVIRVNGRASEQPVQPGKYAELRRKWSHGDTVELQLAMQPRLVEANPFVEEARNQVAVMRGPLVYCLESPDLPAGVRITEVAMTARAELKPRFDAKLLGGVVVLEGQAIRRAEANWGHALYRTLRPASKQPIGIKLIPYYAWANRGISDMTVWVPLVD